jgi:hypothetical protein
MRYITLNMLFDFMQVLNSQKKHSTRNEYFSMYILFTTLYLMQEQKLNPRNYCEQQITMGNFLQATEHDVKMHAKFRGLNS